MRTPIQLIEPISSSLDTDEILRQIAAAAVRLTDARFASLRVASSATRTVELRACSDAAIGAGRPNPRLAYGQGVAGWVTLPCVVAADEGRADQGPEGGESRGSETILLVEDEAEVRELTREILEMAGYTVPEAGRGDEALRLCPDSARPIDLLLTDVVMPQMSGPELARRILDIVLLPKPFTPEALMRHLRRALDGSAKRG